MELTLSVQPMLQLTYQDNISTNKNKTVEVRVYKYPDDDEAIDAIQKILNASNSSNSTSSQTFNSLYEEYQKNKTANASEVVRIINNMWEIVSNAGKLKTEVVGSYEDLTISFTYPDETTDMKIVFTDLKITFEEYGKFQLVFLVDGIESPLSDIIEITQKQVKVEEDYVFLKNYKIFIRI